MGRAGYKEGRGVDKFKALRSWAWLPPPQTPTPAGMGQMRMGISVCLGWGLSLKASPASGRWRG